MIKENLIDNIEVNDDHLKQLLTDYAPNVIFNSRRFNTLKLYGTYFKKWKRWTDRYPEIKHLPAEEKYIGIYLLNLIKEGESFSIIHSTWFALKAYHEFCGYAVCTSFLCKNIYEGAKRILQSIPTKKSPITPYHLHSIYVLFQGENINLKDLRTLTICILSYTGFLRFSEVAVLKREDIEIYDTYLKLFLEQSKTDIYRTGHWIFISKLGSVLCPVKLTKKYIRLANIHNNQNEYMFRRLIKTSSGYRLRVQNNPISYTTVREDFLSALKRLGVRVENYGLHSLRAGGCTMATHYGVKEKLIKKHGRWKSDSVKEGYTHPNLEELLFISRHLGL